MYNYKFSFPELYTEDRVFRTSPPTTVRHPSLGGGTGLSLTINREIANAIFEGARNARGGERQFAAGRGLAESNLHLFEPIQLLL